MNTQSYILTDLSAKFAAARSAADSFAILADVARPFGYTRFHYTQGYLNQDLTLFDRAAHSRMGAEYSAIIDANAHELADPLIDHCLASDRPKMWSELATDYHSPLMTEKHRKKINIVNDYGLRSGVTFRMRRTRYGNGWFYAGISFVQEPGESSAEHDRAYLEHAAHISKIAEIAVTSMNVGDISRQRYGLSAREYDVLNLLAEGLQVQQIADRLSLADRTTAHHLAAMRAKMGARSNAQAVAMAMRMQVI
ncbi:helix-turn-helix transcriptional regulator [Pseudooceanicola spongiae]|uniref:HTH luxR-type domain-containing protein n=1 Tax=Pseudooceanicola spongiae TaxID=2613965 RepID=A0A7L9WN61_9RHOB|nr:LuxR family transcriptional regulator [Pseudooceanicola spongiae]QOL81669.1 hypothetical protein F3W81_13060 [Pseudooceanicola spongiae]